MGGHGEVERILRYKFRHPELLDEALQASGAGPSESRHDARGHGNEALAQIGDAVLTLVIVDDGVVEGLSTAECHRSRADETCNVALYKKAKKEELARFIKLPKCCRGHMYPAIGASTVEALIGAVWIDSSRDFTRVHHLVHNLNIGTKLSKDGHHSYGDSKWMYG